jgi:hypothetical protein
MRIRSIGVASFVCLGICMISGLASAEDWEYPEGDLATSVPAIPPEPAPPVALRRQWEFVAKPRPWYGDQILIADAVTMSLTTVGLAMANRNTSSGRTPDTTLAVIGYASYVLTAPIIHGVHERWGMVPASMGLRVGLPVMGLLYGALSRQCSEDADTSSCDTTLAAEVGLLSGMVVATVLDASLFARENREYEWQETSSVGIAPAFSAANKSGELRVFGTF